MSAPNQTYLCSDSVAPDPGPPLIVTPADLINHRYSFDEHRAGCEASYRRGVHHALAMAGDIADRAITLGEARGTLARAVRIAGDLRFRRKGRGHGMLLDEIRSAGGRAEIGRIGPSGGLTVRSPTDRAAGGCQSRGGADRRPDEGEMFGEFY